ncbi:retrovirus-related pol polyprotein from transposon 17.6 [Tanacetum coccineum]
MEKVVEPKLLKSCLKASSIRNIDGKLIGKDGKPLVHVRQSGTMSEPSQQIATKPSGDSTSQEQVMETDVPDFVLPIQNVEIAHSRFANSLVGFFVGKRVAFPLVQNYVNNSWTKFGFQTVIKDDDDVYYFKFTSITGLEQVLEKGPWMIRNQPMILTKWAPNLSISKDVVTKVLVWAKIHKVPVVEYSEDGLILIASQIGKPIMLDAFTSAMCSEPWGRIGFARALIEVLAEKDLKKEVTMAVPVIEGEGHTLERMVVEYEWTPPQCVDCHVFGHNAHECPNRVVESVKESKVVQADGFTTVNFVWEKKQPNKDIATTSSSENATDTKATSVTPKAPDVALKNSFASLPIEDPYMGTRIILGWNHNDVDVMVVTQDDQAIHTRVWLKMERKELFCTFVYAHNRYTHRRSLWQNLCIHKHYVRDRPWCILGDFNAALYLDDKAAGISNIDLSMREFKECVEDIEVMDVQNNGASHNFISKKLAIALGLTINPVKRLQISLGDGSRVWIAEQRDNVIQFGLYSCIVDALIYTLGSLNMILGIAWLGTLGDVLFNWQTRQVRFWSQGNFLGNHGFRPSGDKQQHDRSNRDPSKAASLKNLSKENPEGKTLDKAKRVQPSHGTPIMDNIIAWNLPLFKQQTRLGRHLLELESNQLQSYRRENNVNNLTRGSNKDDEGIEWLDVKEPLDLVDTSEESVYESLIKEMPKCLLNYDFMIKKGNPRNLKIPCMICHKFTANAYIDVDLPMNIMSVSPL